MATPAYPSPASRPSNAVALACCDRLARAPMTAMATSPTITPTVRPWCCALSPASPADTASRPSPTQTPTTADHSMALNWSLINRVASSAVTTRLAAIPACAR